jgi:hypothetical protein|tara:strand:- start:1196 stop:1837 length:642 start_codon:yes stop_codon:yes gene_type:complete
LKGRKLNLIPLFGDISTLVLAFFILIIVVTTNQLETSEYPYPIPTDKYFKSGKFNLNPEDSLSLDRLIKKEFPKINRAFMNDRLISLRIEGHTDPDLVRITEGRFVTNNNQLSYMRAEQVGKLIENIIEDSIRSKTDQIKLKNMIVLSGFGASNRIFGYKANINGSFQVYQKISDGNDSILVTLPTEKLARAEAWKRLRRVVINPVIRGFEPY